MRHRRSTPLVDTVSSQMMGFITLASTVITPALMRATASVFCMAMRLGTSSPRISVK